jgi:hypothetical protein
MADMNELLPLGDYKVKTVGPPRNWEYNGKAMTTDSIQFEGYEQYWVDVNRVSDKPAPAIGEVLKGHIEQDANSKYAPKFKKESNSNWSGGGNGGGKASPGAIWATAVQTAGQLVSGYYAASGSKPASMKEFLTKVEGVAPLVNKMVQKLVTANPDTVTAKPADTAASESGESPAPAAAAPAPAPAAPAVPANATIQDISDEDLGDW